MKWRLPTYARIRPPFSEDEPNTQFIKTEAPNFQRNVAPYTLEVVPPEFSKRALIFQTESMCFPFTQVFDVEATQEEMFLATTKDAVSGTLDGYNGTVFAYGQTGSGKTYTMTGGDDYESRGLIPRAISALFREVARRQKAADHAMANAMPPPPSAEAGRAAHQAENGSHSGSDEESEEDHEDEEPPPGSLGPPGATTAARVRATYVQLYGEACYDLLDVAHQNQPLEEWSKVQVLAGGGGGGEGGGGGGEGQQLRNLRVYEVAREEDALNLLFLGQVNRAAAATARNAASSRSHCVFTLHVQTEGFDAQGHRVKRQGKLHLVDLAGSERGGGGGAGGGGGEGEGGPGEGGGGRRRQQPGRRGQEQEQEQQKRRAEGRAINLALHHLEQVVVALGEGDGSSTSHVPYRNSLLTMLLRDALGGNTRTAFVVTLAPEARHLEETLAACRFAARCGRARVAAPRANAAADPRARAAALARGLRRAKGELRRRGAQQLQLLARLRELEAELLEYRTKDSSTLSDQELQGCDEVVKQIIESEEDQSAAEDRFFDNLTEGLGAAGLRAVCGGLARALRAARLRRRAEGEQARADARDLAALKEQLEQERTARLQLVEKLEARDKELAAQATEIRELVAAARPPPPGSQHRRANGDHREYYKTILTEGQFFIKHSSKKMAKAHNRLFWVSHDLTTLSWRKGGDYEHADSAQLASFDAVTPGPGGAKTLKRGLVDAEEVCFTLKRFSGEALTLQLEIGAMERGNAADHRRARDDWLGAFRFAVDYAKSVASLGGGGGGGR